MHFPQLVLKLFLSGIIHKNHTEIQSFFKIHINFGFKMKIIWKFGATIWKNLHSFKRFSANNFKMYRTQW